jgi:hypothetical protein
VSVPVRSPQRAVRTSVHHGIHSAPFRASGPTVSSGDKAHAIAPPLEKPKRKTKPQAGVAQKTSQNGPAYLQATKSAARRQEASRARGRHVQGSTCLSDPVADARHIAAISVSLCSPRGPRRGGESARAKRGPARTAASRAAAQGSRASDGGGGRMAEIRRRFQTASYSAGGQDWAKLFKHYDRDNSGELEWEEFRRAVRKDGKITAQAVPDGDLRSLFAACDADGGATICRWRRSASSSCRWLLLFARSHAALHR